MLPLLQLSPPMSFHSPLHRLQSLQPGNPSPPLRTRICSLLQSIILDRLFLKKYTNHVMFIIIMIKIFYLVAILKRVKQFGPLMTSIEILRPIAYEQHFIKINQIVWSILWSHTLINIFFAILLTSLSHSIMVNFRIYLYLRII